VPTAPVRSSTTKAAAASDDDGPWLVTAEDADQQPPDPEAPAPEPQNPSDETQVWAEEVAGAFGDGYQLGSVGELVGSDGSIITTVQLRANAATLRITNQRLSEPLAILPANAVNGGPLGSYTRTDDAGETLVARLGAGDVRIYRIDENGRMVTINVVLLEPSDESPTVSPLSEDELVALADEIISLDATG
jgi:hypothetical protein